MGFGQQSIVFAWFLVHFYDFYPQWSNFPDLLILIIKLHYVVDCKTTEIVGQKKRKFFVEMRLFCNQSSPLQTCFKSPLMCIFFLLPMHTLTQWRGYLWTLWTQGSWDLALFGVRTFILIHLVNPVYQCFSSALQTHIHSQVVNRSFPKGWVLCIIPNPNVH